MADQHHFSGAAENAESPVSVSRLFHTLRAYLPAMLLAITAVMTAYLILAVAAYLLSPSQHVTRLAFRLDFSGASEGAYPNGSRFSSAEVVSTPVLLQVYKDNELARFTSFAAFSDSVFVLEANTAYEALVAEYQARLSDPKLTAVDRERIQKEFVDKRASLNKNEYAIHFLRNGDNRRIPDTLVRKVLTDILKTWAHTAVNEQHVLARVAVLTPKIVDETPFEAAEPVIAIHVLRSKIARVQVNLGGLARLPSAELVRTSEPDGYSLEELRIRLEDLARFRLEPLLADAAGTVGNQAAATRFLESQLAYDQRELQAQRDRAEAARQALAVYTAGEPAMTDAPTAAARPDATSEPVTPQVDASFLDRLLTLSTDSKDRDFRQSLVTSYREATLAMIPLAQEVAYDNATLSAIRAGARGGATPDSIRQQIATVRAEVRQLVGLMNVIQKRISEYVNPSTQLYTLVGTPVSRIDRALSVRRLFILGFVVLLMTATLALLGSLLHARMRQEEMNEEESQEPHVGTPQQPQQPRAESAA